MGLCSLQWRIKGIKIPELRLLPSKCQRGKMNVINPTNTSGFCYKAVLRPLAACARPFALSERGFGASAPQPGISYPQHNASLRRCCAFAVAADAAAFLAWTTQADGPSFILPALEQFARGL